MKYIKYFESESTWHEFVSASISGFLKDSYEKSSIDYLVGKIIDEVVINNSKDQVAFYLEGGEIMVFHHDQDCCEGFVLEDVNGDFYDIINTRILLAEERISPDNPGEGIEVVYRNDSNTWTFYTIRTLRGTVVMRFCGSSNGYYSERCDIALIK
jgi:hypothetical protein